MSHRESTATTGTFELVLEEHAVPAKKGYGYDPYDTIPNVRHPSCTARHADLRRLSEWIRTKKQAEQLKGSDEEPVT